MLVRFFICALISLGLISCKQPRNPGGEGSTLNAINFESPSGLDKAIEKKAEQYGDLKVVGFALSLRGFKKDSTVSESSQDAICNFPALPTVKNSEEMCNVLLINLMGRENLLLMGIKKPLLVVQGISMMVDLVCLILLKRREMVLL